MQYWESGSLQLSTVEHGGQNLMARASLPVLGARPFGKMLLILDEPDSLSCSFCRLHQLPAFCEHWNSMQQQLSQLYSSAIHGHVMVSCAADAVEFTEDLLKIY